ncbi:MAG: hypothetical protein RIR39_2007 [Pseudomonadota bacterium]|jgi:hypothetical protein
MEDLKRLIYVPILHAQDDSKHKASSLPKNQKMANELSAIDEMWAGIAAKIEGLNLPWKQIRIYQDGAPVCGNELTLAKRLAESGSPNFSFILDLINKGATLEGTEDMDLLIQEYDLLNKLLMKSSGTNQKAMNAEYQTKSRELIALRDQFILNRITDTLKKDELPIVFMGVMHRLDKMLEKDFLVSYVIYRLPFRSIGTIYNA